MRSTVTLVAVSVVFTTVAFAAACAATNWQDAPDGCPRIDFAAIDLLSAVLRAQCLSPTIKIERANERESIAKVAVEIASTQPTLTVSAQPQLSVLRSNGVNSDAVSIGPTATLAYTFADGGAQAARIRQAGKNLEASSLNLHATAQRGILDTVTLYVKVLSARDSLAASRQAAAEATLTEAAATVKLQVGSGTRVDLLRARSKRIQADVDVDTAVADLELERVRLARRLQLGVRTDWALTDALQLDAWRDAINITTETTFIAALDAAQSIHPVLLQNRALLRAAEMNLVAVNAKSKPSVQLNASLGPTLTRYANGAGSRQVSAALGVSWSLPIWDGGAVSSRALQAIAQIDAERERLRNKDDDVATTAWQQWTQLAGALRTLPQTQAAEAAASEAARAMRSRYNAGVGNLLELQDAISQYSSATRQRIRAEYDVVIRKFELAYALGILTIPANERGRFQESVDDTK